MFKNHLKQKWSHFQGDNFYRKQLLPLPRLSVNQVFY